MKYYVGTKAIKNIESFTMDEYGIPSLQLQERASIAIRDAANIILSYGDKVLIMCGVGNNGADGLAAARHLANDGFACDIVIVGNTEKCTEEFSVQKSRLEGLAVHFIDLNELISSDKDHKYEYAVVIDALFGIGLSRNISGAFADAIDFINTLKAVCIAVDIPSGIDAERGAVMGRAVHADITVTFTYEKLGAMLYPGCDYCGEIVCAEVGHVKQDIKAVEGRRAYSYEKSDLADLLPERPARSHKGTFGKVLIIAGCEGMCGAAYLSAKAAYRSGVGLVYIYTPNANVPILQQLIPEAVVKGYDTELPLSGLADLMKNCDSVVMGPGLGKGEHLQQLVNAVLTTIGSKPLLIDADGLNTIAAHPDLVRFIPDNAVLTPHIGEMSRLCGIPSKYINETVADTAYEYSSRTKTIVVLKDFRTVVSNGDDMFYLNTSGSNGMATGGSGDVLSGIIGSLMAQGMNSMDAASLGVFIHGLAGNAAEEKLGNRSMMAGDIADSIADVLRGL